MTPTQYKTLGKQMEALLDDYDHEEVVIFGRLLELTEQQRDRLIADELRRLVALHREVGE